MNYVTPRNIIIAVLLIIIGAAVAGGSYTINDRERGVVLRNGKVIGVAGAGWHIKAPFIDDVVKISTQNHSVLFKGLTAYSEDKQVATVSVSVSYHVQPSDVGHLYTQYTSLDGVETRVIARNVGTQLENTFGRYSAEKVIKNRAQFGVDMDRAIRDVIKGPIVIDSVQVENIDFTDEYEKSISDLLNQQNDTQRKISINTATVNAAIADADAKVAVATAEATATRLRGDAEAHAIDVKAKALAQNMNLIELTKAENWDGKLPTTMVPGSAVPFLNVR